MPPASLLPPPAGAERANRPLQPQPLVPLQDRGSLQQVSPFAAMAGAFSSLSILPLQHLVLNAVPGELGQPGLVDVNSEGPVPAKVRDTGSPDHESGPP